VACLNPCVPTSVVEYLLNLGADPNQIYLISTLNILVSPLWDVEKRGEVALDIEPRFVNVAELLKKYGGISACENFGPIESAEIVTG